MPKVIYKYQLEAHQINKLVLPVGSSILSVANQQEEICIWAEVYSDATETEVRLLETLPTGASVTANTGRRFIGTVLLRGGSLVFHVYEVSDV